VSADQEKDAKEKKETKKTKKTKKTAVKPDEKPAQKPGSSG
jgi:hypothetical protein